MPEAVIVAAARSPISRAAKGALTTIRPDDLALQMVNAALAEVPEIDPATVDDLMLGTAQPAGEGGYNISRVVAILAGLDTVPGTTVNRYCSSSLQTTRMAFHAIKAGEGGVFISAGVQTVSRFVHGAADEMPGSHNPVFADGGAHHPTCPVRPIVAGPPDGRALPRRVHPNGPDGRKPRLVHPHQPTRAGRMGCAVPESRRRSHRLRPLRPRDHPGHAAGRLGACPLNDGAAALVITSDTNARQLGLTPLARILATGVSALSPEIMGLGPVEATRKALALAAMTMGDIDLTEINEAVAVQVLGSARELSIDEDKLNVSGGAIALGHPFGMTGARITATLLNNLSAHDKQIGLETMCVGGGQGIAMILERRS